MSVISSVCAAIWGDFGLVPLRINAISARCRLLFTSGIGILAELIRIIEQEQTCCSFFRFRIDVEPSSGPITGPAGTREMLLAL
ncbi:hypothetical protein ACXR0O_07890 [Verrucomicrobiota bacterium sgz303538]